MRVITREFNPKEDTGFILCTWAKNLYHGSAERISTPKQKWFEEFYPKMLNCLKDSTVKIACLEENPYTIIGYSINDGIILDYVYVKETYRNQGIANMLIPKIVTEYAHFTKLGREIIFNRKLRELHHGRSQSLKEDNQQTEANESY